MLKKIKKELLSYIRLIKEIQWPDKKTVIKYSVAVIVISVIITGYLVGLDTLFGTIRNITLLR